ncbi:MAG: transcription termination/antitermination protein NusG [Defluviitaleaceae bacterium]|nr:transcription termination/antitermination protein NusG [Defluviitaleaceae bacterium]
MSQEAQWYVVHTYSGYENKVKANIEKIVENRSMQDQVHEVIVPMLDTFEVKNGQKKVVQKKVYPGYVLIKMQMNDDTWYVVRNTRGVTSFVGPGSKPVALTEREVATMGIEAPRRMIELSEGETVMVTTGPFEHSVGVIKEVNESRRTVIVKLSVFGRETPVELDFTQVQRV